MSEKKNSPASRDFDLVENPMSIIMQVHSYESKGERSVNDLPSEMIDGGKRDRVSQDHSIGTYDRMDESDLDDIEKGVRRMFKLHAKNINGIDSSEFKQILTDMGYKLTEDNLEAIERYSNEGKITLDKFFNLLFFEIFDIDDTEEEIIESFKNFDHKDEGYINMGDLKSVLQNLGNRLNDDELNELVRRCDVDEDNQVSYADLTRQLLENYDQYETQNRIEDTEE